jgi:uncharacterized membrane protein YkoI
MRLKSIFLLASALACLGAPALAKSDKPKDADDATVNQGGNTPNGNAHGVSGTNGSGSDHGKGTAESKNPKSADESAPPKKLKAGEEALEAVESGRALPLATMIRKAEAATAARVIDAQLTTIDGFLLYRLTMLDQHGRVWRSNWYARTGNIVATQ